MGWKRYRKYQKKTYNYNTITSNTGGIQRKDEKIHMKTTDTVTGLLTSQGNVSFICQNVTQQVVIDNLILLSCQPTPYSCQTCQNQ